MGFLSKFFGTSHTPSRSETRQAEDMERDKWLTATEAKKYGIVDEIITNPPKAS